MAKKRGNNEGTIVRRKDGRWMAQMTVGRHPQTGKIKRASFYGKTRKEVADKLTKAQRDQQQGLFVEPHELTLGEWLDQWLWNYKRPGLRATTFDNYEMLIRHHLKPALGKIALRDGQSISSIFTLRRAKRILHLGPFSSCIRWSTVHYPRRRRINSWRAMSAN